MPIRPGHESYTRNTASGASNADLAIILVDARRGLLPQTRRHAVIAHIVGVRHVVLAVNKLDLVGWDRSVYDGIVNGFREFARPLGLTSLVPIPLSALNGDNVSAPGGNTPWYDGPSLLGHLETVDIAADRSNPRCAFWCRPCCGPIATAGFMPASSPVEPSDPAIRCRWRRPASAPR